MSSRVIGDPLPNLVREHPEAIVEPIMEIYNENYRSSRVPWNWKTEYLTIIPKKPHLIDLSECYNISCTSLFSKILENQLLAKLRTELDPDSDQYGGLRGYRAQNTFWSSFEMRSSLPWRRGSVRAFYSGLTSKRCLAEWTTMSASQNWENWGRLRAVSAWLERSWKEGGWQSESGIMRRTQSTSPRVAPREFSLVASYTASQQKPTEKLKPAASAQRQDMPRPTAGEQRTVTSAALPAIPPVGQHVRYFPQDSSDESDVEFWSTPRTVSQLMSKRTPRTPFLNSCHSNTSTKQRFSCQPECPTPPAKWAFNCCNNKTSPSRGLLLRSPVKQRLAISCKLSKVYK